MKDANLEKVECIQVFWNEIQSENERNKTSYQITKLEMQ